MMKIQVIDAPPEPISSVIKEYNGRKLYEFVIYKNSPPIPLWRCDDGVWRIPEDLLANQTINAYFESIFFHSKLFKNGLD